MKWETRRTYELYLMETTQEYDPEYNLHVVCGMSKRLAYRMEAPIMKYGQVVYPGISLRDYGLKMKAFAK